MLATLFLRIPVPGALTLSAGFNGHLYTYGIYSYRDTFILYNKSKSLQKSLLMWGNIEGLNKFGWLSNDLS